MVQPSTHPLNAFVERTRQLYSLPAVAVEVLELTNHPQVDIAALKRCIENDPALVAKILRVVNSSLFGLTCEVSDLNQALALLGIKPLKLLVLGFSLSDIFSRQPMAQSAARYWRHTLTQAIAAREISETVWGTPGDEAFIAALLQDLGILVLMQELGEPYARTFSRTSDTAGELCRIENNAFGFDHALLTTRLLEEWKLPEPLVQAVSLARRPDAWPSLSPRERATPQILYLAGLLADLLVYGRQEVLADLLAHGARDHRLKVEQLTALAIRLQEKVVALAEVFSLDLPTGHNYQEILCEAHNRLAQIAADVVGQLVHPSAAGKPRGEKPEDSSPESDDQASLWNDVRDLSTAVTRFIRGSTSKLVPARAQRGETRAPLADVKTAAEQRRLSVPATRSRPSRAAVEVEPELDTQLRAAVAACRQERCPLSLILVELNHFDDLVLARGPIEAEQVVAHLDEVCRRIDHPRAMCVQTRQSRFAVVLPDCDRQQAVELGNHLLHTAPQAMVRHDSEAGRLLNLCLGVATVALPPKNFSPVQLIDSAGRCLSAAQLSGGNTVKSIGIY